MAKLVQIIGLKKVISNLKRSQLMLGRKFELGLKSGGLLLQREAQKITPVDTSNLRGGARTRKLSGSGFDADIVVEFLAEYAVFVHEDLEARHAEGTSAKFLEKPARQKRREILAEIVRFRFN